MSTDHDYESFLEKANNQSSDVHTAGKAGQHDQGFLKIKSSDTSVPPAELSQGLKDEFYTSDSDFPFDAVAYSYDGQSLDEKSFAKLVDHKGKIRQLKGVADWDPQKRYKHVVDKVVEAASVESDKNVYVFEVHHGTSRSEYYVLAINSSDKNVVGARAKAVHDPDDDY